MLEIHIPEGKFWNEATEEFLYTNSKTIYLEHSLVAISKWESIWKKPFLSNDDKTPDETKSYIKCMSNKMISDLDVSLLTNDDINRIREYINDSMTATVISEPQKYGRNSEFITSELIYYWMVAFNIPESYQYWHINRLLILIKICDIKNRPQKHSKNDMLARHNDINKMRRAQRKARGGIS